MMTEKSGVRRGVKASAVVLSFAMLAGTHAMANSETVGSSIPSGWQGEPTADRKSTDIPPSTEAERAAALKILGMALTPGWTALNDRDFVARYWEQLDAQRWPLTREAAQTALNGQDQDCTIFIQRIVHEMSARDTRNWIDAEQQRKRELAAKTQVLKMMGIEPTPELLRLGLHDFVVKIHDLAKGRHLREAAAVAAASDDPAVWLRFLEKDAGQAKAKDDAEERQLRDAKLRAAAIFRVTATEEQLNYPLDAFIRLVIEWAEIKDENQRPCKPHIAAAARKALASGDEAVYKEFIFTGIHAANAEDGRG